MCHGGGFAASWQRGRSTDLLIRRSHRLLHIIPDRFRHHNRHIRPHGCFVDDNLLLLHLLHLGLRRWRGLSLLGRRYRLREWGRSLPGLLLLTTIDLFQEAINFRSTCFLLLRYVRPLFIRTGASDGRTHFGVGDQVTHVVKVHHAQLAFSDSD